jgi:nucleotide-binding universal stress UspA family protein
MRNIVVATDGSGDASCAVDVAAELTKAFGGKLFIVTVAGDLSGQEMRELALMREKNFDSARLERAVRPTTVLGRDQ